MLKAFINSVLFTGKEIIEGRTLIVENGRISSILEGTRITAGMEIVDCQGCFLAPGFIDLQIAGAGGILFSSFPTIEALETITRAIVSTGTTGFLIALPTNRPVVYRKAFMAGKEFRHPAFLGFHLEGPYLNPVKRGAHLEDCIKTPVHDEVRALLEEAGGTIKMMTVAPEVCDSSIIDLLVQNNVVVAAGHSDASFSEANSGYDHGVTTTTHLFNAMSGLHHRLPGLPGAAMLSPVARASIIVDGIHVDYNMVKLAKNQMGERLFLVSDAVDENHVDAYQHVRQADRFTLPDGTLSGSVLTMMKAVKNCVHHVGIMTEEALRMATVYPAKVMGYADRGKLEAGARADLVLFGNDFKIRGVFVDGVEINS